MPPSTIDMPAASVPPLSAVSVPLLLTVTRLLESEPVPPTSTVPPLIVVVPVNVFQLR